LGSNADYINEGGMPVVRMTDNRSAGGASRGAGQLEGGKHGRRALKQKLVFTQKKKVS